MRSRKAYISILVLSLSVVVSSQQTPAVKKRHRKAANIGATEPVDCDDPRGYGIDEGSEGEFPAVNILGYDGQILHRIRLLTNAERNGFAHDGVKKTKEGFEFGIEYGSRIYHHKRFVFICRQHKFYLTKIGVESFDRRNPRKWSKRVVRVQPKLPLEKFFITDFMLEGVMVDLKSMPSVRGASEPGRMAIDPDP